MLFNDYPFLLVFLPLSVLIYRLADPRPQWRVWVLVLLSLVFYSYWNPPYVALLVLSILINSLAAAAYIRTRQRSILTAAIVANLATLGVFKYANFIADNLSLLIGQTIPHLDLALPLGISFFTFHHIMYLVDLRRGRAPPYPLDRYALYIAFFPQAIAGPLARWSQVIHQFGREVYAAAWQRQFCLGLTFIGIGLIEKIVLADRVGRILDPIYAQAELGAVLAGQSWLALGFGFQILFDFAGYSDIAIGVALLFRVELPFNFDAPYRSVNIQDFWQRWHMTLMLFLRDYVFHPLAHARGLHGRWRLVQYFAAMLATMALCGLWHGASWTFVVWGILHGCALVICSLWRRYCPKLPALVGWFLTVMVVLLTGVIFRAATLRGAWHVFEGFAAPLELDRVRHVLPLVGAMLVAFLLPASQDIVAFFTRRPNPWLAAFLGVVLLALLIELGDRNIYEFVYFKF
jgi:alginate O-acetyltransferase complex protein AlgI